MDGPGPSGAQTLWPEVPMVQLLLEKRAVSLTLLKGLKESLTFIQVQVQVKSI